MCEASFRATSPRRSADIASALAFPPFSPPLRPSATAAGCAKLIAAGKLTRRQSWRAWTTAEIRQAERLLRDGLSWKDVALRLDRTQDALYKIAQLHALQIPRGPYMPHERATVKRMASQGHPARAIAATLGRPLRGVRDFMRRQKIRRAAQQSD